VEKQSQYKLVYEGATPTKVTWERPAPVPVSSVDQQPTPASTTVDNCPAAQPTVPEQQQVSAPSAKEHPASGASDGCRDTLRSAADELPRPPEHVPGLAAASSAKEKMNMSTRPILGVTPNDAQPEPGKETNVQTAPTGPGQLPLATELPSWDLLPAENLLVRRRPITK